MKNVLIACAGAALVAAVSGAAADDQSVVRTHDLPVKERLQYLELINVTAEKPANPEAEALDAELLAILEEAERAEQTDKRD